MEKFSDWVDMSEILDEAALHQRNENDLYGETFEKRMILMINITLRNVLGSVK